MNSLQVSTRRRNRYLRLLHGILLLFLLGQLVIPVNELTAASAAAAPAAPAPAASPAALLSANNDSIPATPQETWGAAPAAPAVTTPRSASTAPAAPAAPAFAPDPVVTQVQCAPVDTTTGYAVYLPLTLKGGGARPAPRSRPAVGAVDLPTCRLTAPEDTVIAADLAAFVFETSAISPTSDAFALAVAPTYATATFVTSSLVITPSANFNGSDELFYTLSDQGQLLTGTVDLTITPVNDTPVITLTAAPISGTLPLTVSFAPTISDVDGDVLSATLDFGDGTFVTNPTSTTHIYAHPGDYTARLSVADGPGLPISVATTISVLPPPNSAPVAVDGLLIVERNSSASIDLARLAHDADSDPLTYTLTIAPAHGQAAFDGTQLTYTPAQGYLGDDTLTFSVDDGWAVSSGQLAISVQGANHTPIAENRALSTLVDTPLSLDLATLSRDLDGDSLGYAVGVAPEHGLAAVVGSTLLYTPTTSYTGSDTIIYTVADAASANYGQISVTILDSYGSGSNRAPLAGDATLTIEADSAGSLDLSSITFDPDGDVLTFALSNTAAITNQGSLDLAGSTLHFTPTVGFTGSIGLVFSATDPYTHTALGQVYLVVLPKPTLEPIFEDLSSVASLQIDPATALFTTVGQTRTLRVRAFNVIGQELPLPDDISWSVVAQDAAHSFRYQINPDDHAQLTVTTRNQVGYIQLKAHSGSVTSSASSLMAVELQPGVVVVPDAAVQEPVSFALPPELAALGSPAAISAWIASQGEGYVIQPHYRAVVDPALLSAPLQPGSRVIPAASAYVQGEIVATNPVSNGLEIIYTSTPITNVLRRAEFEGTYAAEDLYTPIEQDGQLRIGNVGPLGVPLRPEAAQQVQGEFDDFVIPDGDVPLNLTKVFTKEWGFSMGTASKALDESGLACVPPKATNTYSAYAAAKLYLEARVNISLHVLFHVEAGGFAGLPSKVDFNVTGSGDFLALARVSAILQGQAKGAVEASFEGPAFRLRFPPFPLLGVDVTPKFQAVAGVEVAGQVTFEAKKEITANFNFDLRTGSGQAQADGLDPSVETTINLEGQAKGYASFIFTIQVRAGIPDTRLFKRWLSIAKKIKLPDWVPELTVGADVRTYFPCFGIQYRTDTPRTRTDSNPLGNPTYGYGTYGVGGRVEVWGAGGLIDAVTAALGNAAIKTLLKLFGVDADKLKRFFTTPWFKKDLMLYYPTGYGTPNEPPAGSRPAPASFGPPLPADLQPAAATAATAAASPVPNRATVSSPPKPSHWPITNFVLVSKNNVPISPSLVFEYADVISSTMAWYQELGFRAPALTSSTGVPANSVYPPAPYPPTMPYYTIVMSATVGQPKDLAAYNQQSRTITVYFKQGATTIDSKIRRVAFAHELFHAIQYAYLNTMPAPTPHDLKFFIEGTAVLAQEQWFRHYSETTPPDKLTVREPEFPFRSIQPTLVQSGGASNAQERLVDEYLNYQAQDVWAYVLRASEPTEDEDTTFERLRTLLEHLSSASSNGGAVTPTTDNINQAIEALPDLFDEKDLDTLYWEAMRDLAFEHQSKLDSNDAPFAFGTCQPLGAPTNKTKVTINNDRAGGSYVNTVPFSTSLGIGDYTLHSLETTYVLTAGTYTKVMNSPLQQYSTALFTTTLSNDEDIARLVQLEINDERHNPYDDRELLRVAFYREPIGQEDPDAACFGGEGMLYTDTLQLDPGQTRTVYVLVAMVKPNSPAPGNDQVDVTLTIQSAPHPLDDAYPETGTITYGGDWITLPVLDNDRQALPAGAPDVEVRTIYSDMTRGEVRMGPGNDTIEYRPPAEGCSPGNDAFRYSIQYKETEFGSDDDRAFVDITLAPDPNDPNCNDTPPNESDPPPSGSFPGDVCTKGGPTSYEDDYVKVTCKVDTEPCTGGSITKYYRKVEYKGKAQRYFKLTQPAADNPFHDIAVDQMQNLEVRLIEKKTGPDCQAQKVFEPIGSVTASSDPGYQWRWTWEAIPEGTYKLATYTSPQLMPGLHTAFAKQPYPLEAANSDEFTVSIGGACGSNDWEQVDEEDNCQCPSGDCGSGGGGDGGNDTIPPPDDNFCAILGLPGSCHALEFTPVPPLNVGNIDYSWPAWPSGGGGGGGGGGWGFCVTCISLWPVLNAIVDFFRAVGQAFGDPHLATFDGYKHTSALLGEFTYTENITHPERLSVQVRQQRLPVDQTQQPRYPDWASFNTAAAVRAGSHTFELRMPLSPLPNAPLELLIDGQIADFAPGFYHMGDSVLQVERDNSMTVWAIDPNANPADNDPRDLVRIHVGTLSENLLVVGDQQEPIVSLNVSVELPGTGGYRGLLGTPDPSQTDFIDRDGNTYTTWSGFYEAWRVNTAADSYFTYAPGAGPQTFNIEQTATMPTAADLSGANGGTDYMQLATQLLSTQCNANVAAIEPAFITSIAFELASGRSTDNLLASGLCFDVHVAGAGAEPRQAVGFDLSGRVFLGNAPQVDVPGAKVVIRAQELGNKQLCATTTFAHGFYRCLMTDYPEDYASFSTLTLSYRVTGRGAPITTTAVIDVPQPGAITEHVENIAVTPNNVLHLTGNLIGPDELPLVNGLIRVTGPGLVSYRADENGHYDFYMPLPDGLVSGELHYEVADAGVRYYAKQLLPFDLFSNGIHEIEQDIVIEPDDSGNVQPPPDDTIVDQINQNSAKYLLFAGTVTNQLIPSGAANRGVKGAKVVIVSAGIKGGRCETTTNDLGRYVCTTEVLATEAFTAELTLSGVGAAQLVIDVQDGELPAPGSALAKMTDVAVSPTTLHLIGQVQEPDTTPVAGADVSVSSPPAGDGLVLTVNGRSSASGYYDFYLALPNNSDLGGNNRVTGLLKYQASYQTQGGVSRYNTELDLADLPGGGAAFGALTTVTRNLAFTGYTVAFTGRVRNSLVSGGWVPGANVVISSPAFGVCNATTDSLGYYACDSFVGDSTPFSATYQVSRRGIATATYPVDPSGVTLGGRYPVAQTLYVSPTTLLVSGVLSDTNGNPVAGARVGVWGAGDGGNTTTDSLGRYQLYMILDNGQTVGTLNFNVIYTVPAGTATASDSLPFSVPAGALTNLDKPLVIDLSAVGGDQANSSRVHFFGQVRNQNANGDPIANAQVVVSGTAASAAVGTICTATTDSQGLYSCNGVVETDNPLQAAFAVKVGGQTVGDPLLADYNLIRGTAFINEINRDIAIAPTTIKLHGHVTELTGSPLNGATFAVTSPAAGSATTDPQGDYEYYLPLPTSVVSGSVAYRISYRGVYTDGVQLFDSLPPGQLTELPPLNTQLPFTARTIIFKGAVQNLRSSLARQNIQVVVSNDAGQLCAATTDASGNYQCQVQLDSSTPFTATYAVMGFSTDDLGQPLTRTVTNLPIAGGTREYVKDMALSLTTVHVAGIIYDPQGQPKGGATVRVSGDFSGTATTDANGHYDVYTVVPAGRTSAQITVQASAPYQSAATSALVQLSERQLTNVTQNLTLVEVPGGPGSGNVRTIYLQGRVVSRQLAGRTLAVPAAQVVVTTPALATPCSVQTNSEGFYKCSFVVTNTNPLPVQISVSKRGQAQYETTITQFPALGDAATYTKDFEVTPTLLRFQGTIVAGDGAPLNNAQLSISGAVYGSTTTDASGDYDLPLFIDNGVSSGNLNYLVRFGQATLSLARTFSAVPNTVTTISEDITFSGRTFIFKGQVLNRLVPGMALGGQTVVISSPEVGPLCTTVSASNGNYQCQVTVATQSPFEARYTVSAAWGSETFSQDITTLPIIGGSLDYALQLNVAPTTVHFHGTLVAENADTSTTPMAGAQVVISGPGLVQSLTVQTNASGGYDGYGFLRAGVLSGTLQYAISYNRLAYRADRSFATITPAALNDKQEDFQLALRRVTFRGQVRNSLLPTQGMNGSIQLRAPDNTLLCSSGIYGQGDYTCSVDSVTTQAFSATYQISGDWGAASGTLNVPLGAVGAETLVTTNLTATPTMLLVTGRLRDSGNSPISGVNLTISGRGNLPGQYYGFSSMTPYLNLTTDATGWYTGNVVLRQSVLTGTLNYQIAYGSAYGSVSGPFTATVGQRTTVTKDITFTSRQINFSGAIINTLAPTMSLPYATTVISAAGIGQLCSMGHYNSYSCSVQVLNTEAFSVTYTFTSNWFSTVVTGTVAAGTNGSSTNVAQDINVTPTTLHLTGVVDDSAAPINNAYVSVSSSSLASGTSDATDSSGGYDMFVIARKGVTTLALNYTASYNSFSVNDRLPLAVTPNSLNAVSKDFTIALRRFNFSGTLTNTSAPSLTLPTGYYYYRVEIASPELGPLCQQSLYYTRNYSCGANVNTTDPFSLVYTISGDWGQTVITRTDVITSLPPLGSTTAVPVDLGIDPTVLHLKGQVTGGDGQPISNATVRLIDNSGDLSQLINSPQTTTDISGTYDFYAYVEGGVSVPRLSYRITLGSNTINQDFFTPVTLHTANVITRNFTLGRKFTFSGALQNTVVPTATVSGQQVRVSSPGLGELCSVNYASSSYSCSATIDVSSAFDVVYTVSGDWGATVITDTVATLPAPGGSGTVAKDLPFAPTMLRITGVISDGVNPIQGMNVSASSADISYNGPTSAQQPSAASGFYSLDVVLRANRTSGTFNLSLYNSNLSTSVNNVAYTALPGQLNSVTVPVGFAQRRYTFKGQVRNTIANLPMRYVAVKVESPGLGTLCTANTYYNSNGNYQCTYDTSSTTTFPLTYTASGDWGTYVFTSTLPSVAAAGANLDVTQNMSPTVTALRISGHLYNFDGTPATNRSVSLYSNRFSDANVDSSVNTDASGVYTITQMLDADVLTGSIDFSGYLYNNNFSGSFEDVTAFSVTPGVLNTLSYDIAYTSLVISGTLRNDQGDPLSGAYVSLSSSQFVNSFSDYTDSNGNYLIRAIVRRNVASGSIRFYFSYDSTAQEVDVPFSVTPHQPNTLLHDLTLERMYLAFHGDILNELIPASVADRTINGAGMHLTITAPGYGTLCDTSVSGSYWCSATISSTSSLDLVYTLTGPWAPVVVSKQLASLPGSGQNVDVGQDLSARPTTLHLTGSVLDDQGAPPSSASLYVRGAALLDSSSYISVDALGTYDAYVALKRDVSAGALEYEIDVNNVELNESVPFTAELNALTALSRDFTASERRVYFSGSLRNAFATQITVPSYRVVVQSPGLGTLCEYNTSGTSTSFSCSANVATTAAFDVEYVVSGTWGSETLVGSVAAGSVGSYTSVSRDLLVHPTTVQLIGHVVSAGGQPVAGANVNISGSALLNTLSQQVDSAGSYSLIGMLKADQSSTSLTYRVTLGSVAKELLLPVSAPPVSFQSVSHDLLYDVRQVTFSGQVRSSDPAFTTLPFAQVRVTTAAGQPLCTAAASYGSSYSCSAVITSTAALAVSYVVSGTWGVQTLAGSLPAGALGSSQTVAQELSVSPPAVRLVGTLKTNANQPLPTHRVFVDQPSVVASNSAWSDASGNYTTTVIMPADQLSGNLVAALNYGGRTITATIPYSTALGFTQVITRNWTISDRSLDVSGYVRHVLTDYNLGASSVTLRTLGGQTLCADDSISYGYFFCTAVTTQTSAFSVTYTVVADWGTAVFTDTLPAGEIGSSLDVYPTVYVSPTMLQLNGVVQDSAGIAVNDAYVTVNSPDFSSAFSDWWWTDSADGGEYYLTAIVKQGVTSGSLTYTLDVGRYGALTSTLSVPFSATANALTTITRPLTLDGRYVDFYGQLNHADFPDLYTGASRVTISDGPQTLCSDELYGSRYYECTAVINTAAAISVTYTISAEWGLQSRTLSLSDSLATGAGYVAFDRDLALTPPTLHITGTVRNAQGLPVYNASVYVEPEIAAYDYNPYTYSAADGTYDLAVILRASALNSTLKLRAYGGSVNGYYSNLDTTVFREYSASASGVTSLNIDVGGSNAARRINFSGALLHARLYDADVTWTSIQVSSPGLGILCDNSTSSSGSYYSCSAFVESTAALPLVYVVSGGWGSQTFFGEIPASADEISVDRDLIVDPTTLVFRGRITDVSGRPVSSARVELTGALLAYLNDSAPYAYSDSDGSYEVVAYVKEGQSSGAVSYTVSYNNQTTVVPASVSATPDSVTLISRDITINPQ